MKRYSGYLCIIWAMAILMIFSHPARANYVLVKGFQNDKKETRLVIEEVTPAAILPEEQELKSEEKLAPPPIEDIFSIPEIKIKEEEKIVPPAEEEIIVPEEKKLVPSLEEEEIFTPEEKRVIEENVIIEPGEEFYPLLKMPAGEEPVNEEEKEIIHPIQEKDLMVPEIPAVEEEGESLLPEAPDFEQKEVDAIKNNGYKLGPDDVVQISILRHPEFSGEFMVDPHGYLSIPYIDPIKADGLTKYELRDKLKMVLAEYIQSPNVDVKIIGYNSQAVYVVGAVGRQGKYSTRGKKMTVREAIIAAGMPNAGAALRYAYVFSPDPKEPKKVIRLYDVIYRGKEKYNIEIKPGSILYVRSTLISKLGSYLDQLFSAVEKPALMRDIQETYTNW